MGFRRPESPLIDAIHRYAAKPDNCCGGTSTRLVNAFTGCTKDRLDYQLGSGLHHAVPNVRDSEGSLAASGLRDHHPSHRFRPISLLDQIKSVAEPTGEEQSEAS